MNLSRRNKLKILSAKIYADNWEDMFDPILEKFFLLRITNWDTKPGDYAMAKLTIWIQNRSLNKIKEE